MFERKTATSASTTSEAHQNNYTTTSQVPSLSINSSNHLPQGSEPQQQHLPLTNSPSNLSILRDYKHHQQQQGNNNNNTSPQSPPHSPRQNSNHQNYGNSSPSSNNNSSTTTTGTSNNHHNTNKRLSIKLGSSNSNKRLSVNLLLNKLGGGGGGGNNEQAALQHHLQQYSSSMMMRQGGGASNGATNGISSGGANHQMNSSGNTLIGNLDSMNNVLMTREGSQILLGVPYKEGLGYRKTSHWPYRYNKRYFVLKNHHLRIYRAINDYQQHQQYSSIVKHALKQQQHGDSNMNGNVVAINNIINNNDLYNSKDDSNNLSNHSIVTQYSSFTSNMITTPSGDMIPKVDTSSFMLYKIPLKYCKIFKFHTSTNESSNLDYRSSASEMNPKDVPSKSFAATDKKEEKKEDDEEEEFELHFLPPTTYTGPGVTGQKAYKLHDDGDGTNNMSSSPSSVLHGDEVATGSGANSAIFKLKFKGTANDWFNLLDKAIFLASKTGDNEEEDVWKQEQKKDFDEEEWLSQYKKEQQQDMMDLPVFLRPLQMQIKQHNDEMLIDHQEKQKQISAEKNMSLKKRLSQYFSSGSAVNNANTNKRNSGMSSYTVSEKPFDMKSDNLVDSISESTTSHNSTNEKRKSGYVIDDSIPDITDMSQLQDLIRQHDDDDDYTQPSQPKFASDHKTSSNTNAISTLKTEEKKGSALHRLSTNLSELFSKKKQPQPSSSTQVPDNSDTISVDGKKEKRKSVFGRLLNINKEK